MTDLPPTDALAHRTKPNLRPARPYFSSGPCAKPPGWNAAKLNIDVLGRSHRSGLGKARLQHCIDLMRETLKLPDTHHIGIVPGSDTGAFEMAMWTMLGARGVDVLVWESFGKGWHTDIIKQLKLKDVRTFEAPCGELPDLSKVDFNNDVVFTWNGTTSGVRVPNSNWIPANRQGLTFVDATSPDAFAAAMRPRTRAVFAESIGNPSLTVLDIAAVAEVAHAHGVPLVWLVDPIARSLEVYRAGEGRWIVEAVHGGTDIVWLPPFEELEIDLARLWLPESAESHAPR